MSRLANLVLVAPMKGWVGSLDEVPDPVFAERLLGDGLAIDPTGNTVHAPCDGMIASSAKHAVTLKAPCGAEILIHVGLETVALNGQGFFSHVREGRSVKTGDPLLTFDLDLLACKAKSLISPIVITNGDDFHILRRNADREAGVGEFLMELRARKGCDDATGDDGAAEERRDVVVPLAHGIHARPAAVLSNCAKGFASELWLVHGGRRVNAKSIVALMSLGVRGSDRVTILAKGSDARTALDAMSELIAAGLGETPVQRGTPRVPSVPAISVRAEEEIEDGVIRGVCAAPGIAIGQIVHFASPEIAVAEDGKGIAHETEALMQARGAVRARLTNAAAAGDRARRDILGAHIALLEDPEIAEAARAALQEGKSAGYAWRVAIGGFSEALSAIDDARLKERVQDLADLERQVLAEIGGAGNATAMTLPPDAILVARDLLPSELLGLGTQHIAGICTAGGGPTAHVAILAAGMNIPAIVSAGERLLHLREGTRVLLDADAARLMIDPDEAALSATRTMLSEREARRKTAQARAQEECRTADDIRIEVFANLGAGIAEARGAVEQGAEGCGLLRTEFLFQDRATPPSEDEQAEQYQAIADALEGRPLIVRTFDIGGDKPVPYLALPPEENPALGLRGVRAALWRTDLLRTQLAAILRVRPADQCRIMLPMVSALSELQAVRAILREMQPSQRGHIELGVMLETPASAMMADRLAAEADFFSIGTNDLTQYVLAMDRGNPELAGRIDALDPAVLRLMAHAARAAVAAARPIGVCGGLAADVVAAPLLIGLGITELSLPSAGIPALKQAIRALRIEDCRALAEKALAMESAGAVRALLIDFARD